MKKGLTRAPGVPDLAVKQGTRAMLAWRIDGPGHPPALVAIPEPVPRASTVVVRMHAAPLLSYLGGYAAGKLPYWYPPGPFTLGTNGAGVVEAVGPDVTHLHPGQRVVVSAHLVANELVETPAQMLIGLTGISPDSGEMLAAWRDGTLAELALMPAACVLPVDGSDDVPMTRLATFGKLVIPMGGLQRGRLAAGEMVIVHGASGYFGSAAVLLALAMGAGRVIVSGRSAAALGALVTAIGDRRVVAVAMSGMVEDDAKALRSAAEGGAHLAFDMVGRASSAEGTLAALKALRRGGRLVLMGSMTVPLPLSYGELLGNDLEVIGQFMYRPTAFHALANLVRAGLLDLGKIAVRAFAFRDLPAAIEAAAAMRGLDCTVLTMPAAGPAATG